MTTDPKKTRQGSTLAAVLKAVVIAMVLLLLPLAVAFNIRGVADKLSDRPGITKGGGVLAGVAVLVYVGGLVGIVTAGGLVVSGGDLPGTSAAEETPTVSPTNTPKVTETATPTTTETEIETHIIGREAELEAFERDYRDRLAFTYEEDEWVEVPILGTVYHENDAGDTVLWAVYRQCDVASEARSQRTSMMNAFVAAIGNNHGAKPDRLRIYGVTDLENWHDSTTHVEEREAMKHYLNVTEDVEYLKTWWERVNTSTSAAHNETAYQITVEDRGREIADDAFYDDHYEVGAGWCSDERRNPPEELRPDRYGPPSSDG